MNIKIVIARAASAMLMMIMAVVSFADPGGDPSNLRITNEGGNYYLKFRTGPTAHSYEIGKSMNGGVGYSFYSSFSYIDFIQGEDVVVSIPNADGIYSYRVRHTAPGNAGYGDWKYRDVVIGTPPDYGATGGSDTLTDNMCGGQTWLNPVVTDDKHLTYQSCNRVFFSDSNNRFGIEALPDSEYCNPVSVSGRLYNTLWLLKNIAASDGPPILKNSYGWAGSKIDQLKPVCTYDCGHIGPFSGFAQPDAYACNTLTKNYFSFSWNNSYRVRLYDELLMNNQYSALHRAATVIHEARHTDTSSGGSAVNALLDGDSLDTAVVHPPWPEGAHSYQFIWLAWVAAAANPIYGDEIRIEAAELANIIRADADHGFESETPEIEPNLTGRTISNFNATAWVLPVYETDDDPVDPEVPSGSSCTWTSMWGAPGVTVYKSVGPCVHRYKEVYSNGTVKYVI